MRRWRQSAHKRRLHTRKGYKVIIVNPGVRKHRRKYVKRRMEPAHWSFTDELELAGLGEEKDRLLNEFDKALTRQSDAKDIGFIEEEIRGVDRKITPLYARKLRAMR